MNNEKLCQKETTPEQSKKSDQKIENIRNDIITITSNPKESGNEPLIERGIVYLITNLVNNKKYVGITTRDIETRWNEHKWDALNSRRGRSALRNSIVKYGVDNFKIELIKEFYDITEKGLLLKESYYIKKYNTMVDDGCGYNLIRKSKQKLIVSEETRKKMSAAQAGENNGFYGKKHTDEIREKMRGTRESIMGEKNPFYGKFHNEKKQEEITRSLKKYLETHIHPRAGKTFSDESRVKMRNSQLGNKRVNGHDIRVFTFRNVITHKEFTGTGHEFMTKYKSLKLSGVSQLRSGAKKIYKGWTITKRP